MNVFIQLIYFSNWISLNQARNPKAKLVKLIEKKLIAGLTELKINSFMKWITHQTNLAK